MSSLLNRLKRVEPLAQAASGKLEPSVYGVVDRVDLIEGKLVPNCVRKWKGTIGNMHPTDEDPNILLVAKLEPMILKHKKYKCAFGGRAGTKTRMAQDVMIGEINSQGSRVYVLRERMKSLKESIYAGIEQSIKRLKFMGFLPVPSKWEIRHKTGGLFTFGGMQNIIDMKGAAAYKFFLMEEAARTKQSTIDTLGPTLRDMPGAELWWLWNPESSQDPMSQEFIVPYQDAIDRDGYYEDDYHLIIKVGKEDNPWFEYDESLKQEYEKDFIKMQDGRMSKSRFNHIWCGMFNDDIESSIIIDDWFNACIDAHKKLGIEPKGAKIAAFDPADTGGDAKGYIERQGIVFTCIGEIIAENGNRAMDEACRRAIMFGADVFGYDADGLGATLRDNAAKCFSGKSTHIFAYKGSGAIHNPEAMFKSDNSNVTIKGDVKNKDVLYNRKAQNIISFAERVYRTYEAVEKGVYHDPETLISFCSESIKPNMLQKIKAEACKIPLKPGDTIRFYTKDELKKGIMLSDGSRIKIPSPNLFDAAKLSFDKDSIITKVEEIDLDAIYTSNVNYW
ncbi:terminase large subunit [Vibrio phage 1.067.O._10N.261.52.C9]|nr:terminase large subunit [Vibrio phage 1.067.O._10N.261.52.C9]